MPKRTFQPKKKRRIKRLGFLRRARRSSNVLKNRRAKGRKKLTPSDEVRGDKNKRFSRRK